MRMVTDRGGRARALLLMLMSVATGADAIGLDETVGQLLQRDAQEAIAGRPALASPPPPPRLLPELAMAPMSLPAPPPPIVAPPMVTAIYGAPGQLSVVLQIDRQRIVLDQRTGRSDDAAQPARLAGISGSCARILLTGRGAPTTLCVNASFGMARRSGGMP